MFMSLLFLYLSHCSLSPWLYSPLDYLGAMPSISVSLSLSLAKSLRLPAANGQTWKRKGRTHLDDAICQLSMILLHDRLFFLSTASPVLHLSIRLLSVIFNKAPLP